MKQSHDIISYVQEVVYVIYNLDKLKNVCIEMYFIIFLNASGYLLNATHQPQVVLYCKLEIEQN